LVLVRHTSAAPVAVACRHRSKPATPRSASSSTPGASTLLDGMVAMELARTDPSIATFMGVHGGLAMGSIYLCGSEEQKRRWLPAMARMELLGAFGLTEPEVGSGASRGLATTARRDGDAWVLAGRKKWIGNASFADLTVIWARDVDDGQVKGFVVEAGTPGFATENLEDKIALRVVQNALITLEDVRVPEANRLQAATSFRDTAEVLRMTRAGVAWMAVMSWKRSALSPATRPSGPTDSEPARPWNGSRPSSAPPIASATPSRPPGAPTSIDLRSVVVGQAPSEPPANTTRKMTCAGTSSGSSTGDVLGPSGGGARRRSRDDRRSV
jgi:hypothetical protein